ncbi:MAG TPA: glycosyltransferase [Terracidiphilus sp.]|jgi:hypothetical protein
MAASGGNKVESVLLVRSAFGEIHELAWVRALRDLGINVELFDTHAHIPQKLLGRMEEHYLWGPDVRKVNQMVLEGARKMRPDVVHFYQGHHYTAKTIANVGEIAFASGLHNDDPFGRPDHREYRLLLKALPKYDGYHVNRECNLAEAATYGMKRVRVLMMYYIPWLHYPCSLTVQEQTDFGSDVVFAGHMEPDLRIDCLAGIIRAGLKCRIFGGEAEWKSALPVELYESVGPIFHARGADYRRALCASKIAACFFSKWNRDQYTTRSWEIPACGVFLLSERTAAMQEFYREGIEAEFFSSPAEFVDKARFYVNNESARKRIATAGYERVIASGNDIYSRMRQWLADVTLWRNEKRLAS